MCEAAPSEPIQTIFGALSHLMDGINIVQSLISIGQGLSTWGHPKNACVPSKAKSSLALFSAAVLIVILCHASAISYRNAAQQYWY